MHYNIYRPPTKLREGNVFSRVCPSVSHSVGGEGRGPHVTITHDILDLTIQGPPPGTRPHYTGTSLLVTSGGQGLNIVQTYTVETCSLEDPSSGADIS